MKIQEFNGKRILVEGVGKLFFEQGFPISMSIDLWRDKNVEVSLLHVADECMKNGWSAKTTFNKLLSDFEEDITGNKFDFELLKRFCFGTYEEQREMIFEYLFGFTPKQVIEVPKRVEIDLIDLYKKWLVTKTT